MNKILKDAKDHYYNCKLNSKAGDTKGTWKVLGQILNKSVNNNTVIEGININNSMVKDPYMISNHINNYFSNIGCELSDNIPPSNASPLIFYQVVTVLSLITPNEINSIIKSLKDSSAGFNNIHVKLRPPHTERF